MQMKFILPLALLLAATTSMSGCSNAECKKIVEEVQNLEFKAEEEYRSGMANPIERTVGSKYTVEFDKTAQIKTKYKYNLKIIARMVINNEECFSGVRVAEAQELIGEESK